MSSHPACKFCGSPIELDEAEDWVHVENGSSYCELKVEPLEDEVKEMTVEEAKKVLYSNSVCHVCGSEMKFGLVFEDEPQWAFARPMTEHANRLVREGNYCLPCRERKLIADKIQADRHFKEVIEPKIKEAKKLLGLK